MYEKIMLRVLPVISLALSVVLLVSTPGPAEEKKPSSENAATVNGTAITRKAVELELKQVRTHFARQGRKLNDSQLQEMAKGILENMISRELLYQESIKQGFRVDESLVTGKIKQIKQRFRTEEQYQKALDDMGFTQASLESKIRYETIVTQFIENQFADKIAVSEQEARQFYDSNPTYFKQSEKIRASHILIKVEPSAGEAEKKEARRQIEAIQQKIKQGDDFGKLARQYSQGPSNVREGDLGYFGRNQMVKTFEQAAFALKVDEVSDIVETPFGLHLIKLFDKKPAEMESFEQARGKITQNLKKNKVRRELSLFVDKLKEKAKIQRF